MYVCINPVMYLNDVRIFCSVTNRNVFQPMISSLSTTQLRRNITFYFICACFFCFFYCWQFCFQEVMQQWFQFNFICIILNVTGSSKVQLLAHFFDKLQRSAAWKNHARKVKIPQPTHICLWGKVLMYLSVCGWHFGLVGGRKNNESVNF